MKITYNVVRPILGIISKLKVAKGNAEEIKSIVKLRKRLQEKEETYIETMKLILSETNYVDANGKVTIPKEDTETRFKLEEIGKTEFEIEKQNIDWVKMLDENMNVDEISFLFSLNEEQE